MTAEGTKPGQPADTKNLVATLNSWRESIGGLVVLLSGALGTFFAEGTAKRISYGVIALGLPVLAYGFYLTQSRRSREEVRRIAVDRLRSQPAKSAFRDTYPFEEGEDLPGQERVREARSIATRVANDDFTFGIVCGDSGCGKTSLLQTETKKSLQQSGYHVQYIRSPRNFVPENGEEPASITNLTTALEHAWKNLPARKKSVLIIDQFEDALIEHPLVEEREQLAKCLRQIVTANSRTRVLCAIRREYLVDVKDLASELSEPLSVKNLFPLKNFLPLQAKDVVEWCARAAGNEPDPEFVDAVVNDLQEGGYIRPPELQIVCTRLGGSLTLDSYRDAGGASGILAHYVRDAISVSTFPDFAARLLRALTDLLANARSRPKTARELLSEIGSHDPKASEKAGIETTVATLQLFVAGRLVIEEPRRTGDPAYLLTHDYLAEAIKLATSEVSTRTEDADRLLRYYLAQKTRVNISIRQLREIREFASKSLLEDRRAKTFLRRSGLKLIATYAALFAAMALVSGSVYLLATARIVWADRRVLSNWGMKYAKLSALGSERIMAIGSVSEGDWLALWDSRSARQFVDAYAVRGISSGRDGQFILAQVYPWSSGHYILINLSNLKVLDIHFPASHSLAYFVDQHSEHFIIEDQSRDSHTPGTRGTLHLFYAKTGKEVGHVEGIRFSDDGDVYATGDGKRLLVLATRSGRSARAPAIYDISTGKLIGRLKKDSDLEDIETYDVDEVHSRIMTIHVTGNAVIARMWNLADGSLLNERSHPASQLGYATQLSVAFSNNGLRILVCSETGVGTTIRTTGCDYRNPAMVLSASDLTLEKQIAEKPYYVSTLAGDPSVAWQTGDATIVWPLSEGKTNVPRLDLRPPSFHPFETDTSGKRLAFWSSGKLVLWDLVNSKQLWIVSLEVPPDDIQFTADERALVVTTDRRITLLIDATKGEVLTSSVVEHPGALFAFDPTCRRIFAWTMAGEVIRYREGRNIFGTFRPTVNCPDN